MVMRSFLFLAKDISNFKGPSSTERDQLKTQCLSRLAQRRTSRMRPIHRLAYMLDPRYSQAVDQPNQDELGVSINLTRALAAAHDTRFAFVLVKDDDSPKLRNDFPRTTADHISGECTAFRSHTGGSWPMDATWCTSAIRDPLVALVGLPPSGVSVHRPNSDEATSFICRWGALILKLRAYPGKAAHAAVAQQHAPAIFRLV